MVRNNITAAELARSDEVEKACSEELTKRLEIVIKEDNGELVEWVRYCGECCPATEASVVAMEREITDDRISSSMCTECRDSLYNGKETTEEHKRAQRDSQKLNRAIMELMRRTS